MIAVKAGAMTCSAMTPNGCLPHDHGCAGCPGSGESAATGSRCPGLGQALPAV